MIGLVLIATLIYGFFVYDGGEDPLQVIVMGLLASIDLIYLWDIAN